MFLNFTRFNMFALQRLPPLSTEPNRCEKAFVGNTIGQANGVYDKPIDLRFCDYTNDKSNLKGKSLAAALMSDAKFDGADMTEVVMSKAYAVGASFRGNFSIQSSAILSRSSTPRWWAHWCKFFKVEKWKCLCTFIYTNSHFYTCINKERRGKQN